MLILQRVLHSVVAIDSGIKWASFCEFCDPFEVAVCGVCIGAAIRWHGLGAIAAGSTTSELLLVGWVSVVGAVVQPAGEGTPK